MEDVKALILSIVKPLVTKPEDVTIELTESDEFMEFQLHVDEADVGRVIGKSGRVAQAIRTIVYGVKVPGSKRVRLNILDN